MNDSTVPIRSIQFQNINADAVVIWEFVVNEYKSSIITVWEKQKSDRIQSIDWIKLKSSF